MILIPWLMACSGSYRGEFAMDYADVYCQTLVDCDSDWVCSSGTTTTTDASTTDAWADCTYDNRAAGECIDGDWTCGDDGLPVPPDVCWDVFDCPE